jgi:hypothetical protein
MSLILDCANGVGAFPASEVAKRLHGCTLHLMPINTPKSCDQPSAVQKSAGQAHEAPGLPEAATCGRLNHECGSDWVQVWG